MHFLSKNGSMCTRQLDVGLVYRSADAMAPRSGQLTARASGTVELVLGLSLLTGAVQSRLLAA